MANEKATMGPDESRRDGLSRDAYLYWIHCNRCFSNYIKKEKPHYVLACKHVVCEPCLTSDPTTSTYKCPMCNKLVRGRQMNNSLPSHIKNLFHPEPWLDDLPLFSILNFQQKQRQHYIMEMTRQKRQIMKETQSCKAARNAAKAKFEKIEDLRKERMQLEKRVRGYIEQRNKERAERASRPPIPSTTDDSYITTRPLQQRPRLPAQYRSQQVLQPRHRVGASSILPPPILRLPNPSTVLNFSDLRNSTFKL